MLDHGSRFTTCRNPLPLMMSSAMVGTQGQLYAVRTVSGFQILFSVSNVHFPNCQLFSPMKLLLIVKTCEMTLKTTFDYWRKRWRRGQGLTAAKVMIDYKEQYNTQFVKENARQKCTKRSRMKTNINDS